MSFMKISNKRESYYNIPFNLNMKVYYEIFLSDNNTFSLRLNYCLFLEKSLTNHSNFSEIDSEASSHSFAKCQQS